MLSITPGAGFGGHYFARAASGISDTQSLLFDFRPTRGMYFAFSLLTNETVPKETPVFVRIPVSRATAVPQWLTSRLGPDSPRGWLSHMWVGCQLVAGQKARLAGPGNDGF